MSKLDGQQAQERSVHGVRVPVSAQRAPLRYNGLDRDNFVPRWVKDEPDRLEMFLAAGYEFVKPKPGHGAPRGDSTVDSSKGLDGRVRRRKMVLMQLPKKFYDEDQRVLQKEIDETEEAMKIPGKGKAVGKEIQFGSISLSTGRKTKEDED